MFSYFSLFIQIAKQAVKTTTKVCGVIDNNDIRPHLGSLVEAMRAPDMVPECIKRLSSTTFVADVTGPALAVMVPLLARALNERNSAVQRSTSIIVENLTKLVRDPHEAVKFLPALTPGVERIAKGAAFPEVREHAQSALDTLQTATKAVGDSKDDEDPKKVFESAKLEATARINKALTPHTDSDIAKDTWAQIGVSWLAKLIVRLADKRVVQASAWDDVYVLPYLRRIASTVEGAKAATAALREEYVKLDEARFGAPDEDTSDVSGECLCRIQFSLAYGGLLLLNHTTLRLHRGHRYGVVAANGSGKSTLLRAMNDGKVENYPTEADGLRTVMVEHNQGEGGDVRIVDFIHQTPKIQELGKSIEEVHKALSEVGFDEERRMAPVSSLSGGWKMKLALARAMLIGADVYLLDEPTNHLDVASVAWLENFLTSNPNITVLTVSHDSGFLDNVCTDIMHYENKKIKYYPGNLSKFVEKKPEAKSYYSLSTSNSSFTFPPPGSLMGIRSQTRTILKATDVTFTYPGASKPSLSNASVAVSLSSRIGVLGPNGAGKSTLIKILTQEMVPQEGKVERHPNLRISTLHQHAFHHIEQHLEKTAVQYITWRFLDGHDREISEMATRKVSQEEKNQMDKPITALTGEKRKIEYIVGRQKLKKSFQYEIKWVGMEHRHNTWIPRDRLMELGFSKLLQKFDDFESSREGAGSKELSAKAIRKHLMDIGLNGEIAEHHEMSGLSGGQKVKVVLAAALWNSPQILVLDEPTNFLDRDSVAMLATAIRNWSGAVVIITHNMQFVEALCTEIWTVEGGKLISKTKTALATEHFADDGEDGTSTPGGVSTPGASTPAVPGSKSVSRLNSKAGTPMSSAAGTPADTPYGSGAEDQDMSKLKSAKGKKKKKTRNELKAQEERRRVRLSKWLTYGGEREPDTEEEK
jgi:elongation factor 3